MTDKFYTARGYELMEHKRAMSASLEDYMEMIYRLNQTRGYVRVNELAHELHVKPPSVTKMLAKLVETGLIDYEKYGVVKITEDGIEAGKYLIWRHEVLEEFFGLLVADKEKAFVEAERAEHILSAETVLRLEIITEALGSEIAKTLVAKKQQSAN